MSIKEKVQQIIQQAEAEMAAKLRREEEARLRLAIEAQELVCQREVSEEIVLENGRKAFESLGIQGIMADVFDV